MENKIAELEYRICELERRIDDPWRPLLDGVVREYIREHYPYGGSCDADLYWRVLESMKEQIITLLMGGNH